MTSFIDVVEACARVGTMIIAGTLRTSALSYMAPASDYCFIGEECFVASALASGDPMQAFSIRSLDIIKIFSLGIIAILLVSAALGQFDSLVNLLGM
jgi:hypothetical protein